MQFLFLKNDNKSKKHPNKTTIRFIRILCYKFAKKCV
jgi:hypothetical protein